MTFTLLSLLLNHWSNLGRHCLGLSQGAEGDLELALLHELVCVLAEHADAAAAARTPAVPARGALDVILPPHGSPLLGGVALVEAAAQGEDAASQASGFAGLARLLLHHPELRRHSAEGDAHSAKAERYVCPAGICDPQGHEEEGEKEMALLMALLTAGILEIFLLAILAALDPLERNKVG